MNIILFLFVIIASVFFASGIYNFASVINGTDYMFEKAGIGDYQLIALGENAIGSFENKVRSVPEVKSYSFDTVIYMSKGDVFNEKRQIEIENVGMLISPERAGMTFFDKDDNAITSVRPGEVYVTCSTFRKNNLKTGDRLTFELGDTKVTLTVAGTLKDAFLGSEFFGNPRFLVNDSTFKKFLDDETASRYYGGELFYIKTDDPAAVGSALSDLENVAYSKPVSMIKMGYVMNLIVAFVVIILSICLMIVSFLVLRFTINFSISEDFREIGVMKAIGIKNRKIRTLYLTKYAVIAVTGSVIGFFLSIPFGKILLKSMTQDMILGASWGYTWNIAGSVCVTLMVILFAYLSTSKIKRLSPIDAVRSGQTGERFKKKGGIRITKNVLRPSWYLAVNDIFSSPKRFVTIIVTFSLCTLLVLMIVNTANTMNSDKLVYLFGPPSDVYITDNKKATSFMHADGEAELNEYLDELAEEFTKEGMPCTARIRMIYTYQVEYEGNTYSYSFEQDWRSKVTEFKMHEGKAPSNEKEVAVTKQFTELTGAKPGDTIRIDYGDRKEDLLITGYFQSMNQLGKVILLHEDAPTDFSHLTSPSQFMIDFTDDPDQRTIDARVQKIRDLTGNNEVFNAAEFCVDCVKVYDIMDAVAKLLLLITLIVVILITILMERSFIADEKSEIAIAKAVGFKDSTVIRWHVQRFFIVALVAMLLAVGLSMPMTDLCISPIFGMMGASDIDYNYDILRSFVMYPGAILIVTVVTAFLTALYTKKIGSRNTANNE
ncbi:MAG: ABC transporter permease [Clostridiales bacterium]|nr:ABC transporter permease [Clostridiales bacterium]